MENLENLTIYTSDSHGKWVAATGRAPFFCFEGDTEEAALNAARDAILFYQSVVSKSARVKASKTDSFNAKNRVRASELAMA